MDQMPTSSDRFEVQLAGKSSVESRNLLTYLKRRENSSLVFQSQSEIILIDVCYVCVSTFEVSMFLLHHNAAAGYTKLPSNKKNFN